MLVSKSTLFSLAAASMFVGNVSAGIVTVRTQGEEITEIGDGRRLSDTTSIRFPVQAASQQTCKLLNIQIEFSFPQQIIATEWTLIPAGLEDGGGTPINAPITIFQSPPEAPVTFLPVSFGVANPTPGFPVQGEAFPAIVAVGFYNVLELDALVAAGAYKTNANVNWFLEITGDRVVGSQDFLQLTLDCPDIPNVEGGNDNVVPGIVGDPHFTTFGASKHYDFQGACDVVSVQNNGYKNGKGMHVHARTKSYGSWSSVVSAAVKIGDDVLEVHGEDLALINGVEYPVPAIEGSEFNFPMTIGGYALTVQILGPHTRRHIIHMGDGEKIMINNFKEFVDVQFQGVKAEDYDGAVGMLGAFSEGGAMMGRDGKTVFEDADAFGQEWQVRPTDPHLFHIIDGPQYPARCNMPEAPTAEQRHLRAMAKKVSEDDAKKACANASRKDNCIADVFGSDNLEMAQIYTMGSL